MYAQAGLSLCWSLIPHCWKSHVTAQISERNHFLNDRVLRLAVLNDKVLRLVVHNDKVPRLVVLKVVLNDKSARISSAISLTDLLILCIFIF